MKRLNFIKMRTVLYYLVIALFTLQFQACSNEDDGPKVTTSPLEKDYFAVEGAEYKNAAFPAATTDEGLYGVDMSSQVMNGAMNYISIVTEQNIQKFFIGVEGVEGFWEYVPNTTRAENEYQTYVIPMMMSQTYTGNATVLLSGQLENGEITPPYEGEISYIETMPGAIEIKLAFSNAKDVDLHLYTPSGEHIFYGNQGGSYFVDDTTEVSYGLDIDSNAACEIDGINKENIYIPAELVESGVYTVVVDMYRNCDPSIATNWSIVARYQGELITPMTGMNPASGIYPIEAGNRDMTEVMTFSVEAPNTVNIRQMKAKTFKPIPLTDMDRFKMEKAGLAK